MYVGCTVVTRNYLPLARVLAASFVEHNENGTFVVLIADDEAATDSNEPFTTLFPGDIGIGWDEFERRGAMFGPLGLACSFKAPLLRHVVREYGTSAIFLDADSCVYADLARVAALASAEELVLSPHIAWPLSRAEVNYPLEETFLKFGVFNGGFVAVGTGARAFLDWWVDRTARRCIVEPAGAYLVDQNWLTLAPAFFPHHVLHDPGCNVMYWNLYDRDIEWAANSPIISGGPLRHFHFTGFKPSPPETFELPAEAHHANFPGLEQRPGLKRLARQYATRLVEAGLHVALSQPPPFVALPNGRTISDEERRQYREHVEWAELNAEPEPTNPFRVSAAERHGQ